MTRIQWMASVVLVASCIFGSIPAVAKDRLSLLVDPECPTPGETIRLWATVETGHSTLVAGAEHVSISGNTIQFFVDLIDQDSDDDGEHDGSGVPFVISDHSVVGQVGPMPAGLYQVQLRVRRATLFSDFEPGVVEDFVNVDVREVPQPCAARHLAGKGEKTITARVGQRYSKGIELEVTDARGLPTDGPITLERVYRESEIGPVAHPDMVDIELARIAAGRYEVRARANLVPGTFLYRAQLANLPSMLSTPVYFVVSNRLRPDAVPLIPVVQYVNNAVRRYFMTADVAEMAKLDAGHEWRRTGDVFLAYSREHASLLRDATPVCRFHTRSDAGFGSHFFSPLPEECSAVERHGSWLLETDNAFSVFLPDKVTGACPHRTRPIYRAFNNRPDAGHIYATAPWLLNVWEYPTGPWIREGYGPDPVAFCAPE